MGWSYNPTNKIMYMGHLAETGSMYTDTHSMHYNRYNIANLWKDFRGIENVINALKQIYINKEYCKSIFPNIQKNKTCIVNKRAPLEKCTPWNIYTI